MSSEPASGATFFAEKAELKKALFFSLGTRATHQSHGEGFEQLQRR